MNKIGSIIDVGNVASKIRGTASGVTGGGGGDDENESLCPTLSFKQRVIGCACMMGVGMIFSIMSWVAVFLGDLVFFGVIFTLGNLCSVGGTLFLAGPKKQAKSMFTEARWIATTVYLVSMVLTILAAVLIESGVLVIICCLIQYAAMWWYFLSYVPFARDFVKSAVMGICKK